MKTGFFSLAFLLISVNLSYAQENQKNSLIRLSPLSFFGGALRTGYEGFYRNKTRSALLDIGIIYSKTYGDEYSGFNIEFQPRFYLNKDFDKVKEHWYITPYFFYQYSYIYDERSYSYYPTPITTTVTDRINSFSSGYLFGFMSDVKGVVFFDLYAGGGIKISDPKGNSYNENIIEPGYSGVLPKAGFEVGIAF